MQVRDVMTKKVKIIAPTDTIDKAAKAMEQLDCGALPVGENDRLVGIITDRDIALRAVGRGKAPAQTSVRDVMSHEIKYVFDDETTDTAAESMSRLQVRRLPVLNREKRLVGIVALGDLAMKQDGHAPATALKGVSRPTHAAA